jgi:hypothetical protein
MVKSDPVVAEQWFRFTNQTVAKVMYSVGLVSFLQTVSSSSFNSLLDRARHHPH